MKRTPRRSTLADVRANGGATAAESEEIPRQARLIRDHAAGAAEVSADAEFVCRAYERLHERKPSGFAAAPARDGSV